MSRNKENETNWRRTKYHRFVADINKEEANEFLELLKNNQITFHSWIKDHIKKYISESHKII